jgi:3-oxoacyl-[acyl-carrier protein] reductase
MFNLNGKSALITGATGGIGGTIARTLHARGATIVVSGRTQESVDKFVATFTDGADRVHGVVCDLAKHDTIDAFAKTVLEVAGGKLDILVNNAGLTRDTLMMRMTDEM